MSAQSIAPRSRNPQRPETDDVVLARALEFAGWARNNVVGIAVGAVLVALILGGLIYYRSYQAQRQARAAAEYVVLEQTLASGNTPLAVRELQSYVNRFKGTDQAGEATLLLARLHLEQGEAAQAAQAVEELAREPGASSLAAQAALLLAAAQQAAGQTEQAVATYLRVADTAEMPFRRAEALAGAALLRMQAQDFAGAAELYRRLVEMNEEGGLERSLYEMRLAEAEAQAEVAAR
jgi:predicted negative regulator of RcsB-dependent stress response